MAGRTENLAGRGEGVGPVESHQKGAVQNPVLLQAFLFQQTISDHPDDRGDFVRIDRIENVPDLNIRGDVVSAKEGLDVVAGAKIKFLSIEPLLGPIPNLDLRDIDWVIVGGEY